MLPQRGRGDTWTAGAGCTHEASMGAERFFLENLVSHGSSPAVASGGTSSIMGSYCRSGSAGPIGSGGRRAAAGGGDQGKPRMLQFSKDKWPELLIVVGLVAELLAIIAPWL